MRRMDDYIRAGADPAIRTEFLDGIDTPLVGGSGRTRTASQTVNVEADRRRRDKEMAGFLALKAATSGA